jgi:hypothetical protein
MEDKKIPVILFYRDGNNDKDYIEAELPLSFLAQEYKDNEGFSFIQQFDSPRYDGSEYEIETLGYTTDWLYSKKSWDYDSSFDHNFVSINEILEFEKYKDQIVRYTHNINKKNLLEACK